MFVVLGATGHVGSAVAAELLHAGEGVTVVVRDQAKGDRWEAAGAAVAVADVRDVAALRQVFRRAKRAFLLNPPAPVSSDTDTEERRTAAAIVAALDGSELEKVVAQSAYGAQPGRSIGDLGVLHEFEAALAAQPIPVTILRGAYYMSNWDPMLDAARQGTMPSMLPADLVLPMVAPTDLGAAAARLLRESADRTDIRYVEGPARYSPDDVANAFAAAVHRPVNVAVTPRDDWIGAYRALGFSAEAATSFAGMTALCVDGEIDVPTDPERGSTSLTEYITKLSSGNYERVSGGTAASCTVGSEPAVRRSDLVAS